MSAPDLSLFIPVRPDARCLPFSIMFLADATAQFVPIRPLTVPLSGLILPLAGEFSVCVPAAPASFRLAVRVMDFDRGASIFLGQSNRHGTFIIIIISVMLLYFS